jgi:hypothetical protein
MMIFPQVFLGISLWCILTFALQNSLSKGYSLPTAVGTATSLCHAVVEWMLSQLSAIGADALRSFLHQVCRQTVSHSHYPCWCSSEDGGAAPKSQTELLSTLDMGQDLLMLAMAEWPVSEHMHAMRVSVVASGNDCLASVQFHGLLLCFSRMNWRMCIP